jgi:hypothetical protein
MDANLQRRVEQEGTTLVQVVEEGKRKKIDIPGRGGMQPPS